MRQILPQLLSLFSRQSDSNSNYARNSSQGSPLYQIRGQNRHRNQESARTVLYSGTVIFEKYSGGHNGSVLEKLHRKFQVTGIRYDTETTVAMSTPVLQTLPTSYSTTPQCLSTPCRSPSTTQCTTAPTIPPHPPLRSPRPTHGTSSSCSSPHQPSLSPQLPRTCPTNRSNDSNERGGGSGSALLEQTAVAAVECPHTPLCPSTHHLYHGNRGKKSVYP